MLKSFPSLTLSGNPAHCSTWSSRAGPYTERWKTWIQNTGWHNLFSVSEFEAQNERFQSLSLHLPSWGLSIFFSGSPSLPDNSMAVSLKFTEQLVSLEQIIDHDAFGVLASVTFFPSRCKWWMKLPKIAKGPFISGLCDAMWVCLSDWVNICQFVKNRSKNTNNLTFLSFRVVELVSLCPMGTFLEQQAWRLDSHQFVVSECSGWCTRSLSERCCPGNRKNSCFAISTSPPTKYDS